MQKELIGKNENRIAWVDNLKAFGILAIFCGHMGSQIGRLYQFVFAFHVPLFFLVSGLFASKYEQLKFKDVVKKRMQQIVGPYFFLVAINLCILIARETADFTTYMNYVIDFIALSNCCFCLSLSANGNFIKRVNSTLQLSDIST